MVKNPKYRHKNKLGYVFVKYPKHPRASKGYVFEHILVAEEMLGKPLPEKTVVHHLDGDPTNNDPKNLMICPDQTYHQIIHQRERAKSASGLSFYRLCNHCGKHDHPNNLYLCKNSTNAFHRECRNTYERERYHKRKAEANE